MRKENAMVLSPGTLTRCLLLALTVAGLAPLTGLAASPTVYEGALVPDAQEPPLPIRIELSESERRLSGQAVTEKPLASSGPVSGNRGAHQDCRMTARLGNGATLEIDGQCTERLLQGTYTLTHAGGMRSRGSLQLPVRKDGTLPPASRQDSLKPDTSLTSCINASTRCLTSCPRGEQSAEQLCANRCRSRYQACKKGSS
ncbi:hypothetical protein [Zoogloea sp.]|uniref:hypothetical protein n=1 Tax=Zoogloea sp. TaxID=49181 RepID=UPI00261423B3|nr:hypothetical protein [Zoogloea sp.]MDD3355040.1 hypothetical protein [Zoogloea sp.]